MASQYPFAANNDDSAFKSELNQSFQGFHQQNWSQAISEQHRLGNDYVIATVLGTMGSTPRGSGSKMVITAEHIYDTLGGGHLEFKVIEKARQLLAKGQALQVAEQFNLGASLGQCCGGATAIMFEVMISQHMNLDIYGAGHVAQALVNVLAHLPINIRWIDSRADVFPQQIPANVRKVVTDDPVAQADVAKPNTAYLILTHNHQLDFALTQAILKRDDAAWLGVIGSETKAKRFRYRLSSRGFASQAVAKMQCPVGLDNVSGKLPMEVAVSIAGQLIGLYQQHQQQCQAAQGVQQKQKKREGLQWHTLNACLNSNNSRSGDDSNNTPNQQSTKVLAQEKQRAQETVNT
ncbi:xanthine dehydrogenase accessory protein XdhC [Thalassotalea euphylliae]|uniref:Xanthine dehydrogenase accessory protein XdhC n=1 Tax=Thalassotalea euphylliae TaxID=1655234 RepID=A0A3E0TSI7_9GAMM|nr:xanthine dehydrogenase accessory protein XdhC [Thalassotalea euphylliae]REL27611.1 xanthine dehydrogenase accessory protein XdhC [Thalassotalea euphylliae]